MLCAQPAGHAATFAVAGSPGSMKPPDEAQPVWLQPGCRSNVKRCLTVGGGRLPRRQSEAGTSSPSSCRPMSPPAEFPHPLRWSMSPPQCTNSRSGRKRPKTDWFGPRLGRRRQYCPFTGMPSLDQRQSYVRHRGGLAHGDALLGRGARNIPQIALGAGDVNGVLDGPLPAVPNLRQCQLAAGPVEVAPDRCAHLRGDAWNSAEPNVVRFTRVRSAQP
jgi:hypothetical protein